MASSEKRVFRYANCYADEIKVRDDSDEEENEIQSSQYEPLKADADATDQDNAGSSRGGEPLGGEPLGGEPLGGEPIEPLDDDECPRYGLMRFGDDRAYQCMHRWVSIWSQDGVDQAEREEQLEDDMMACLKTCGHAVCPITCAVELRNGIKSLLLRQIGIWVEREMGLVKPRDRYVEQGDLVVELVCEFLVAHYDRQFGTTHDLRIRYVTLHGFIYKFFRIPDTGPPYVVLQWLFDNEYITLNPKSPHGLAECLLGKFHPHPTWQRTVTHVIEVGTMMTSAGHKGDRCSALFRGGVGEKKPKARDAECEEKRPPRENDPVFGVFDMSYWREVKTVIRVDGVRPTVPVTVTLVMRDSANQTCIQIQPTGKAQVYTVDALLSTYDQAYATQPIRLHLTMSLHSIVFPDLHAFYRAFLTFESRCVLEGDGEGASAPSNSPDGEEAGESGDPIKQK